MAAKEARAASSGLSGTVRLNETPPALLPDTGLIPAAATEKGLTASLKLPVL